METERTRCFVSLELPESFTDELIRLQEELKQKNLFCGKFTEKRNLHLTLKFLGEITSEELEKVKFQLKKVKFDQIKIRLGELGVFNPNYIRIIWNHITGAEELQKQIDEVLESMFDKENRFQSHITIARIKSVKNKVELLKVLKEIKVSEIELDVDKFFLKKSTLTREGPVYETIENYPV